MTDAITYAIACEHGRWVSRCLTGETEGVGVADSLSQLEHDLTALHAWAWPHDVPRVNLVFPTA